MSTVTITDLARENVRDLTPYQSARRLGGDGDVAERQRISHSRGVSAYSAKRCTATPMPAKAVIENYASMQA
ncbi:hypothetical protein ACNKHU_12260 [Shigella flexneri]